MQLWLAGDLRGGHLYNIFSSKPPFKFYKRVTDKRVTDRPTDGRTDGPTDMLKIDVTHVKSV